ncbi:MAG: DUF58 domain-containing protein [Burkholderiaceae bacterium]|jgi:uncharacterized protein (DUF58 family)|nr:DUF58 domain-containing protein [Burkholderiaceae bacterium]
MTPLPSRHCVQALALLAAACGIALLLGAPPPWVAQAAAALLVAGLAWLLRDVLISRRAWYAAPLRARRLVPHALALGVPTQVRIEIENPAAQPCVAELFDEVDPRFSFDGLPQRIMLPARGRFELAYTVIARQRGPARFGRIQLRRHSLAGSFEQPLALGQPCELRVYPNFAALTRYAWLAGDRRLAQIGIKTYAQRGGGTEFRQLSEYRAGDPVRHIDWKATLRQGKPVVREFQDERDQRVLFLLDCGRRMRADEGAREIGGSHFDDALNALMLLACVALKEGDEVGVITFGNPPGLARHFAPRKGRAALDALMNALYDLQPSATHSDYAAAAHELMRTHPRRALVIMLTNFRDEDADELQPALQLLRRRHLSLVASLRERVLGHLAAQPLDTPRRGVEVAAAHLFEQSRRDAFARVTGGDALSIDVEPAQLATALVNRYHAVKRAGLL